MTLKENEREERMRRVRVGLTGLAAVLVLVLLATAILARLSPDHAPATNVATASGDDEPLADLGVAPGAPDNSATNAVAAKEGAR